MSRLVELMITSTKRLIFAFLSIMIASTLVVLAIFGFSVGKPLQTRVFLGNSEIVVNVVDTPEGREKGLSGHKSLESNEGMLFIFPEEKQHGFWMKEMLFPIDIIWLDSKKRIIYVKENAKPESYPEVYTPSTAAQFVLEVPEGFFAQHHLKVGDSLEIRR